MSTPASHGEIAVGIRGVSKRFRLYRGRQVFTVKDLFVRGGRGGLFAGEELWALRDVSLEVPRGCMVGIVGSNGSGKSTLLKLVGGILKPTTGAIRVMGRVSALIELGAGFHPEFTGRENVYVNGILLGLSRAEIRERFDEIVAFAGLDAFIDNPVKTYSSGMYMRLGFAIAVTVDPDILLIDEVLAVGDEAFQHQCIGKIQEFKARGKTILLVSHDLGSVERLCDEAVWLHGGRLMARGGTRQTLDRYLHQVASEEADALGAEHREAEAEAAAGTAQRWGSREVEITRVRLTDRSGQERYLYDAGESCTIRLAFRAPRPVEDPVFGIGVFRRDGVCCYGTNTAIDGLGLGKIVGESEVSVEVHRLDLIEGEYLLDVAVHARDGHPYDYHSRLYAFAVRSRIRDTGVARLAHAWRLPDGGGR
ncbi:MAG: ABC transporter ATP-binding protein [Candidatus Rokubacteria bacterium]|nr:ABC transporter ATP-binding protein [Candidatus Rokubacteria bacterium]